ncbi:MAG: hypothetical protein US50_C0044G0010 [Candidatus Nomurabacteria bacterium GW2011_GWB1_37_5]|uniref:Uncharacterized protein n=1 Tax=Candidatus Nomurabacteria bacterium GW2011_GWB1_37_5 TaxID=1618742 RepID=A0A0G0GWU5_9BACT|nr:MAG: hypothetical protein US50_C0044G0010 [Candidatus Nomurabacteria bacterium GW2011_GWB1_37_5]
MRTLLNMMKTMSFTELDCVHRYCQECGDYHWHHNLVALSKYIIRAKNIDDAKIIYKADYLNDNNVNFQQNGVESNDFKHFLIAFPAFACKKCYEINSKLNFKEAEAEFISLEVTVNCNYTLLNPDPGGQQMVKNNWYKRIVQKIKLFFSTKQKSPA